MIFFSDDFRAAVSRGAVYDDVFIVVACLPNDTAYCLFQAVFVVSVDRDDGEFH